MNTQVTTPGALFKHCRQRLGYSVEGMKRALRITGERTVRRWEADQWQIPGPAWIAVKLMLIAQDERLLEEEPDYRHELRALAAQIDQLPPPEEVR